MPKLTGRAAQIMASANKMNGSKKRNHDEFMSQGILEIEKVLNDTQIQNSIPDTKNGIIDEAAEQQREMNINQGDNQNDLN